MGSSPTWDKIFSLVCAHFGIHGRHGIILPRLRIRGQLQNRTALIFIHLFLGLSPPSAPHEDQHTGLISTAVSSSHDYSSTSNPIICQQVTERRPKDEEITQINQPISISQTKKLNDTNQSAELNDNKQTDDQVINRNKISDNESTNFSPGNSKKMFLQINCWKSIN